MNLRDVILTPVMTEKSLKKQAENIYTFLVDDRATKPQIKEAVEKYFSVKVIKVWISRLGGERRKNWRQGTNYQVKGKKKAYVKIASNQKIELLKGK